MPKQPIAVEQAAINQEGEIQTVQNSEVPIHGYYSVYVQLNCPDSNQQHLCI